MYAATSTSSPRSGPTSGDDDGLTDFDGAGEILRAWGNGLRPDPDLTVSEWADRHRMLSGRASAEPGRYRTVRTPYMREIMDRLSPGAWWMAKPIQLLPASVAPTCAAFMNTIRCMGSPGDNRSMISRL